MRRRRGPARVGRRRAGALALGLLFGAAGAQAAPTAATADVADWAPAETQVALVLRGADGLGGWLTELEARFGQTRTLQGVIPRLRAFEVAGARPFAGDWGAGLDAARGLGVFAPDTEGGQGRLVVGLRDGAAGRTSLLRLFQLLSPEATFEGDRLTVDGKTLICAERGPWLVCDPQAPPAAPPGRPAFLAGDAWVHFAARGKAAQGFADGLPLVGMALQVAPTAEGGRVALSLEVAPEVLAALESLKPADGPVGGADCLDRRAGFVGRLSVDAQRLFAAHGPMLATAVPAAQQPLLKAAQAALTGEVLISTAGGFSHPLVTVGVKDAAAGKALLQAAVAAAQAEGAPATLTDDRLTFDVPLEGTQRLKLHLRHGLKGQTLVIGLAERDVARCVGGEVRGGALPEVLAAKGSSGFVTWAVPGGGLPPGLYESEGAFPPVVGDLLTVAGVYLRLLGELGVQVRPGEKGLDASLWWSLR